MKKLLLFAGLMPTIALAQTTSPESGISILLKTTLSLCVVLGSMLIIAWAIRRFQKHQFPTTKPLRIIDSISVGNREKIALIQVGTTWIVAGITPKSITSLTTLPAQVEHPSEQPASALVPFSERLRSALIKNPK